MQIDYFQFHNTIVRDLAWMIGSPSLLSCPTEHSLAEPNIWIPSLDWQAQQYQHFLPHLQSLEKNQQDLKHLFFANKRFKLGLYFENLMHYWFSNSAYHELVAHRLTLLENNRTIGEIDFLVWDHECDQLQHWEVAVKFYLGFEYTNQKYWLGPNLKDRFDLKLQHTLQHQLKMSEHASLFDRVADIYEKTGRQLTQTLANKLKAPIQKVLWFKGILFEANINDVSKGELAAAKARDSFTEMNNAVITEAAPNMLINPQCTFDQFRH